jgi:hypothetical protein
MEKIKVKNKRLTKLIAIRVSENEKNMADELKEIYFINISSLFREILRRAYDEKKRLS